MPYVYKKVYICVWLFIISEQPYNLTIGSNYSVKTTELSAYKYSYNGKLKCDHFKI